jgi:hypothetical protein
MYSSERRGVQKIHNFTNSMLRSRKITLETSKFRRSANKISPTATRKTSARLNTSWI